MKKIAHFCILFAGCLWGSMGIFVRHFSSAGLGAMDIGQVRIIFGLIMVGLYLLLFHREYFSVRWKDLWCFAGSGVGSLLLMMYTQFSAMQYGSIAVASVLLYTAPAFVLLFSALFFREKITGQKLLSLVLVFTGCALVSGIGTDSHSSPYGVILGLSSGLAYSLYTIFGRCALNRGYNSWTITFYSFAFCVLAGTFLCDWTAIATVLTISNEAFLAILMGLFTAFAPFLLYSIGLTYVEGSRASILAASEPIAATMVSVMIFHESIGGTNIIGMLLILFAIILLSLTTTPKSCNTQ